ncbi:unnamed protein product [Caenorhabditis auriculariae]|uniref:ubiquitinyl hydrolase 1 n=1 Tax=Caenorhabditis auriculariae TaxID=2777116 RepID=A0A8S1GQG6_9PELO|nr:unnamed protein product [Caenorhabditis auriculariae]
MSNVQNTTLYHEKQSKQFCLMHTLNNILQKKHYTAEKMDELCYTINDRKWFNPHRSWLGFGNYDANVLMCALELHHLKMVWFDKRTLGGQLNPDKIRAFIFNIPSRSFFHMLSGRHWYPLVKVSGDKWYNLDSKLSSPKAITDLPKTVGEHLAQKDVEMIIVCHEDIPPIDLFIAH